MNHTEWVEWWINEMAQASGAPASANTAPKVLEQLAERGELTDNWAVCEYTGDVLPARILTFAKKSIWWGTRQEYKFARKENIGRFLEGIKVEMKMQDGVIFPERYTVKEGAVVSHHVLGETDYV